MCQCVVQQFGPREFKAQALLQLGIVCGADVARGYPPVPRAFNAAALQAGLLRCAKLCGGKFLGFLRSFLAGVLHGVDRQGALVIGRDGIVEV